MNDLFGESDSDRIVAALLISQKAESRLEKLVPSATSIWEDYEDKITHHTLASDERADPMGPAKLIGNSLVFTTLKSEGLESSIHVPSRIKCKLN